MFRWVRTGRRRILLAGGLLALVVAGIVVGPRAWIAWRMARARAALQAWNSDEALLHLRAAGRFDGEDAELHFLLARAFRRQGRFDDVRQHLERAFELGFDVERLRREQWLAQAQAGQLAQAEPHLADMLKDPRGDGPAICEAYVDGYFATYRFERALTLLKGWEADFPADPQPLVFQGLFHQQFSRWPDAAEYYRRALKLDEDRHDVRRRLARLLVEMHEYEEAAQHFQAYLDASPGDVDARSAWGQCLSGMGRDAEAQNVLAGVLVDDPQHFEARLSLAQQAVSSGRHDEALRQLVPLADERPTDVEVRYALAKALAGTGRGEDAREHFAFVAEARQEMLEVQKLTDELRDDPDDPELRFQIGSRLLKYDDPAHGAAWLRSVVDLNPSHPEAHAALADYYGSTGNRELADAHRRLAGD